MCNYSAIHGDCILTALELPYSELAHHMPFVFWTSDKMHLTLNLQEILTSGTIIKVTFRICLSYFSTSVTK